MNIPFKIHLKNKVVVVTGGGGVLCSVMSKALAECGAKVAVLSRRQENADKVVNEIIRNGGTAVGLSANILEIESLNAAKKIINKTLGTCDVLINGAGGTHPKGNTSKEYFNKEDLDSSDDLMTFFDLDPEGIDFVFNLNFTGTLVATQVFAKDMINKKEATIINISSMSAFSPLTKVPAYSAAKAAISNFTQWLAVHMSKTGIRVNAIAPGFFLTKQNKALLTNEDGSYTERAQKVMRQTPMDRFGKPEELVGTLLWLVDNNASSFVNGTVIPVDGGFSAYSGV